ncbi:MAG TPA: GNAT family N-acetyltransferase [Longimicrobiaceae bacterium]|nr:GNAT family N-acetyltransferase [Longimicrobiaceae bacterium]
MSQAPPASTGSSAHPPEDASADHVFVEATPDDVADVVALRAAAARDLTARYGRGHWSGEPAARGVLHQLRISRIWLARRGGEAVATFRLGTRKPWAIDPAYFTPCAKPLYLTDLAVRPDRQRRGVGRGCLAEAVRLARGWPADAVRLDAYDAEAGAGGFYLACGFREVGRVSYRGVPLVYYERLA